ncbi:hypothetical protein Tco_0073063 [Tanacetum coccineum]
MLIPRTSVPFSPSMSVPMPTLALTDVTATVDGRVQQKQSVRRKKKFPFDLRGSKKTWSMRSREKLRFLKRTSSKPITTESTPITEAGGSSQITPRVDKGKGIATKTDSSAPKLIKASRAHNEKLKKKVDLRKKWFDKYVSTINNRYKPERITDIFIHPRTRPVLTTVYKNNDPRSFDVHGEFKFSDFRLTEWDELGDILPKKTNKCVGEMMTSLSTKYERLKKILEELGLDLSLPLLEQDP